MGDVFALQQAVKTIQAQGEGAGTGSKEGMCMYYHYYFIVYNEKCIGHGCLQIM